MCGISHGDASCPQGLQGSRGRPRYVSERHTLDAHSSSAGGRGHGKGGGSVTEHAKVVVGADGRFSRVAQTVGPEQYNEKAQLLCGYYSYWSDLPIDGRFEVYIRPGRGWGVAPTHDGLTLLVAGWPYAEFEANKSDVEGNYLKMFDLAPEFAERVRG